MGASASVNTIVSNVTNRVENRLIQEAGASAEAICTVRIGSIVFSETQGCTITVKNLCSADAIAQVDAVVDATIEFYNELSFEQKQEAPSWFTTAFGVNTTVSNIENDFKQLIEQRCKAESVLNSTIEVQNITVRKCVAPPNEGIMAFTFINSGKASGQCAISALIDLQVSGSNNVAVAQSQGMDWSTIIWPVVILGIVICIVGLLYYLKEYILIKPKDRQLLELTKNSPGLISLMRFSDYIKTGKF